MKINFLRKTSALIFITFFLLQNIFLASCSNNVIQNESEEGSIKYAANHLESQTQWTSSIDGDILSQEIKSPDDFDKSVKISPNNIYLLSSEKNYENIFPYIQNFGSLNISTYDESALSFIQDFCNAFIKNQPTDSFFEENHIYTSVVFNYQLEKIFNQNIQFTKYLLGEAFVFEDYLECPVRFFYDPEILENQEENQEGISNQENQSNFDDEQNLLQENNQSNSANLEKTSDFIGEYKKNNLDVFIYLKKIDNNYKIEQISFM